MAKYDANLTLELIRDSLVTQRIENAVSILLNLHPVDRAEIFDLLDDAEQEILLDRLDIPTTADLLEELEDDDVLEAIESLTTERLADVLDEMEPDWKMLMR
jgi:Mg/Co/Ni transporter MgtE